MNAHTPGPWTIFRPTLCPFERVGIDDGNGATVIVFGTEEDDSGIYGEGNANLIAAAPELLEALVAAEIALRTNIDSGLITASFERAVLDRIHDAIIKATGEQG